jgi:aspartyl protease family protein
MSSRTGLYRIGLVLDARRIIGLTARVSALLLLATVPFAPATSAPLTVKEKLSEIARVNAFAISGLDRVGDEKVQVESDASVEQLSELLSRYNFAIITQPTGKIQHLVISGRKGDGKVPVLFNHIKTSRVGFHHQVEAKLIGPNGTALTIPLLVDTGSSTIVLPLSLAADLGFKANELVPGVTQTANGNAPVQAGTLQSVTLGTITRKGVAVSFVDDERLGTAKLLGMSFLGHFKLTIDDERQELILLSK